MDIADKHDMANVYNIQYEYTVRSRYQLNINAVMYY